MLNISKSLVYSVSNLKAPDSTDILRGLDIPQALQPDGGIMEYSIGVIQLRERTINTIKGISASIAENFSFVRKSYEPVMTVRFFAFDSDDVARFVSRIGEQYLQETNFQLNGEHIADYAGADGKVFKPSFVDKYPDNYIKTSNDSVFKFPYVPKFFNGGSILDEMDFLFSMAFKGSVTLDTEISIPNNKKYLYILPYATAPVPTGTVVPITTSISVSAILNFNIEEK